MRGGGNNGGATKTGATKTGSAPGDVALAETPQQQDQQQGGRGFGPAPTPEECATINAAIDKHPKEKAKLDELRNQMMAARASGGDMSAFRPQMTDLYKIIGVDGQKAGRCRGGRNGANGRAGGAPTTAGATTPARTTTTKTQGGSAPRAGTAQAPAQGQLQPSGEIPAQPQRRRSGLVFVATDTTNRKFAPRLIQLGQGNFDYTEVLSGLKEGERVVLVSALMLQAQRQAANDRTKAQMGVPGLNPNAGPGGAGGRGPGGPGGGGAPGGGGGAPARGGRGG
jgi:hypothetical protein